MEPAQVLPGGQAQSAAQGQDVEDAITALQTRVFEEMGVQGAFGLQCLGRISTAHKADREVIALLYRHVHRSPSWDGRLQRHGALPAGDHQIACAGLRAGQPKAGSRVAETSHAQAVTRAAGRREEEAASEAELSYEQLRQKRQTSAAMASRQAELQQLLQALPPEQREVGSPHHACRASAGNVAAPARG